MTAERTVRITGGQVMVRGAMIEADVLVKGERIAALLGRSEPAQADETIDATGQAVLPGIIDTHTHTREPGYTNKEDFYTASRAAAVGGVTTLVDMPNVEPPTNTAELFLEKRALANTKSIVDWGHWSAGTNLEEIPRLAAAGTTGYKIFQVAGVYPHDPRLAVNDEGRLLALFRAIAKTGLPCVVHPFDQSLFDRLSEEAFAAGKPSNWMTFSELYTNEAVWHSAVGVLLNLQQLSGVRLHLAHTHSARSLQLIREAKARGQRVTCEVDPKYYTLTLKDLQEQTSRACPGGLISSDPQRMEAIWRAFNDGTLDNIGTDHAPHTLDEIKVQDTDAWHAAMGSPQLDWLYSLILTSVSEGKFSLSRCVELLCEAPAKLVGVWPQKGALLPGSDADLVLVDLDREVTVTDESVETKVGWTPYRGYRLKGYVNLTMLRGVVIMKDRKVLGKAGYGRYVGSHPQ
jgi:dihydroorotase